MSSHSSSTTVTESVVSFLEKIPPFQFLPQPEIRTLARTMTLEYFPKDTVILAAGRQVSEALYIVQKGAVKLGIRTNVGKELVLDMRSEGEVFGLLSLMGRDVARLDVVALEDTLCYTHSRRRRTGFDGAAPRSKRVLHARLNYSLHGPQPRGVAHPSQPDGQRRAAAVLAFGRRCGAA